MAQGIAVVLVAACCLAIVSAESGRPTGARREPVLPPVPSRWPIPPPVRSTIDYAAAPQADAWLRHPILGDPSFDAFVHHPKNPFVVGKAPFKWPVNVSVLIDPPTRDWVAYVGHYLEGYDFGPGKPITHCRAYRSRDRGTTWTELGPVFSDKPFRFEGDAVTSTVAPDVTVVYHAGRYHMAYDWATDNTTWATASAPQDGADGGFAYAVADRPEGPFRRAPRPILRTSELQRLFPGETRYRRPYACSLIRRKADWMVLADVDSGPYYAWGQVAMTARDPLGAWSKPVFVSGLEGDAYYPAPVEAFPAFVRDGYVYDPRTSVGANRNFQLIMRAKVEEAHRPEAWRLYQHGSVWHSDPVAHEGFGIWGQTLAAADDLEGGMVALFPSRHWPDSVGTIGSAVRRWDAPLRLRGFVMSGHSGPTVTFTRAAYKDLSIEAVVALRGAALRVAWGAEALVGPVGRADGKPDPLSWTRCLSLELREAGWRLTGPAGQDLASGSIPSRRERKVRIEHRADGTLRLGFDGVAAWSGSCAIRSGAVGLLLDAGTHVEVSRFVVSGVPRPATHTWLAGEAVAGAGVNDGEWRREQSPAFRFGSGGRCLRETERLKWNFRGRGFRLWSPRDPSYGRCNALLNGEVVGTVDLRAPESRGSEIVLERHGLRDGYHALVLQGSGGVLPIDCLDALQ